MVKRNSGGRSQKLLAMNKVKGASMKQPKTSGINKNSKASTNPNRKDPSGGKKGSQFRTKATINRINMYKDKPNIEERKK